MNVNTIIFFGVLGVLGYMIWQNHFQPKLSAATKAVKQNVKKMQDANADKKAAKVAAKNAPPPLPEIADIVDRWEELKHMCQDTGRSSSVKKLEEMFCSLNVVDKGNANNVVG